MKVVHINKTDVGGGAAVAAHRIHNALRKAGVDSSMLVLRKGSDDPNVVGISETAISKAWDFANFVGERLAVLPHEKQKSVRFNISLANTGRDITRHPLVQEADIIHLHWVNQGFLSLDGLKALAELHKPIVWTLHDMWPFTGCCHYAGSCLEFNEKCGFCPYVKEPARTDISAKQFQRKKAIYKNMNLNVVACSQWLNSFARSGGLFRDVPCYAIPNPIDTKVFSPQDKAECRTRLGLPQGKRLLLFGAAKVSDIRKGFRYLDEALRIISDSFPGFTGKIELVMFGQTKGMEDIDDIVFRTNHMDFISDTKTIVDLYNAADLFVLPSLQDNLPNTVVESLACGTPVVGFRTGGVPEMVEHGRTGYLAEVKNSLSLAQGICHMLFFDSETKRENVAKRAEELFGESRVAGEYIKVYEAAMNRQK